MRGFWQKWVLVMIGGIFQGVGMGLFLFPQAIPSGGAGGLAILLNHFFLVPMGPALWIVNFLFLLLGINYLGKRFALWTIFGMTIASYTIDLIETYVHISGRSFLIDVVFGSIFLGIGVGTLMRQGVSNGGVCVLAYMISFKGNISPGKPLFIFNSCIFLITAAAISWHIIFLALITQWMSTRIVNFLYDFDFFHKTSLKKM